MCTALGTFLDTPSCKQTCPKGFFVARGRVRDFLFLPLQNPNLSKIKWSFERSEALWAVGSKGLSSPGCGKTAGQVAQGTGHSVLKSFCLDLLHPSCPCFTMYSNTPNKTRISDMWKYLKMVFCLRSRERTSVGCCGRKQSKCLYPFCTSFLDFSPLIVQAGPQNFPQSYLMGYHLLSASNGEGE